MAVFTKQKRAFASRVLSLAHITSDLGQNAAGITPEQTGIFAEKLTDRLAQHLTTSQALGHPDEICRSAGYDVLGEALRDMGLTSSANLFVDLCIIASQLYEEEASLGSLTILAEASPVISLHDPIPYDDVRGVRKLLEIAHGDLHLLGSSTEVAGLGYPPGDHTALTVEFLGHGVWQLRHRGNLLMRVSGGLPQYPHPPLEEQSFKKVARYVFTDLDPHTLSRLFSLINTAALTHERGTNILITPDAAHEVVRLAAQCTLVEPFAVTEQLMSGIIQVDGTVIISPDGVCYGIGAILDGLVTDEGNPTRGGRYNSAVMYCANSSAPCLIVVISQDGMVDLISSPAS
ncbi:MAG: hypothetical protein GYB68_01750 [Chloroflexi bacterium]|nr:hypothetical protein [Chloroflexota bacterium]